MYYDFIVTLIEYWLYRDITLNSVEFPGSVWAAVIGGGGLTELTELTEQSLPSSSGESGQQDGGAIHSSVVRRKRGG